MERKPTRPSPVPGTSKKKKKKELDLVLASSRQAEDLTDVSQARRLDEVEKTDNTEKVPLEKAARLESSDYEMIGLPKTKREEVTEEQRDTKEILDDNAEAIGAGFYQKIERFNELMDCWKTLPHYNPNVYADLEWLEENVADYLVQKERNLESVQQPYPFHPSETLKVLNPEAEFGPLHCKCPVDRSRVGCTTETAHSVLPELTQNTHPKVRAKSTQSRCKCGRLPRMKLSRTSKNRDRLFLTCGRCGYFRWLDNL